VFGGTLGSPLRTIFLIGIQRRQAGAQQMTRRVAQVATDIVADQTLAGGFDGVVDLFLGLMEVLFDVGIAVHDQSPGLKCRSWRRQVNGAL
jgi:hypothetical protein